MYGNIFSAILAFAREGLEESKIDTITMGNRKIVYDISRNFIFVVLVKNDYETLDAKRVLSHLRVTFSRMYPILDDWQFDGNVGYFSDFQEKTDEIINQFARKKVYEKTQLDHLANIRIEAKSGEFLPLILKMKNSNLNPLSI